jgi:hypothetical protein
VTGFSSLVLSDPTVFYTRSSFYRIAPAVLSKATKYNSQLFNQ